MRFHDITFFCYKKDSLSLHIKETNNKDAFPITISINNDCEAFYNAPRIVIHCQPSNLFEFVQAVNSQYEKYLAPKEVVND